MALSDDQRKQQIVDEAKTFGDILRAIISLTQGNAVEAAQTVASNQALYAVTKAAGTGLIEFGFQLASDLLAAYFTVVKGFRDSETHTFDSTLAAILTEFLAIDFDPAQFHTAASGNEAMAKAEKIGAAVHGALEAEFTKSGNATPAAGKAAAQAFSGFAVNMAIQNGLLTMLGGVIPQIHLDDVRELGEGVATNMGLGRLHARAMRPLVDTLIAKPYDRELCAKYRPNLLPMQNYVRQYWAGRIDRAALSDRLGQLGIAEADIDEIVLQLETQLPLIDLTRLIRYGRMTVDQAAALMQNHGWPKDLANTVLQGALLARVDSHVNTYISLAIKQYVQGFITEEAFEKLIQNAPLTDDERQWISNVAGMEIEAGRRRITFAQLETGLIAGIVDWDYVDTWLAAEGYDEDSKLVLQYELLLKLGVAATKSQLTTTGAKQLASSAPPKK